MLHHDQGCDQHHEQGHDHDPGHDQGHDHDQGMSGPGTWNCQTSPGGIWASMSILRAASFFFETKCAELSDKSGAFGTLFPSCGRLTFFSKPNVRNCRTIVHIWTLSPHISDPAWATGIGIYRPCRNSAIYVELSNNSAYMDM